MSRKIAPYIFISPFFVLFSVFMLGPALYAFYASLTRWRGLSSPEFIKLKNYTYLLEDKTFHKSLINTSFYALVGILIVVPTALLLASLLNTKRLRGRSFFRAVYFVPVVTPGVVIGVVFALVYGRDYGLFNWVMLQLRFPIIEFMTASWFKVAVAGMIIWRWSGYHMVYFLAGLQGIPQDLYEAARMDGANAWQGFCYITVPMLRPTTIFVLVIMTISSFQIFDEPFMLLQDGRGFGGPSDSGLSITMYLYRAGFVFMRRGYGSAIGSCLFLIILVLSLAQTKALGLFREDQ